MFIRWWLQLYLFPPLILSSFSSPVHFLLLLLLCQAPEAHPAWGAPLEAEELLDQGGQRPALYAQHLPQLVASGKPSNLIGLCLTCVCWAFLTYPPLPCDLLAPCCSNLKVRTLSFPGVRMCPGLENWLLPPDTHETNAKTITPLLRGQLANCQSSGLLSEYRFSSRQNSVTVGGTFLD